MVTSPPTRFGRGPLTAGLILVVIGMACGGVVVGADETDDIEADARDYLKQMSDYLAAAKEFSFEAEVTSEAVVDSFESIHLTDIIRAVVRRPDRLWIDTHGDMHAKRGWYDGSNMTILSDGGGFYATAKTAGKLDQALDDMMNKYGVTTPVVDFLFSNPYESLMADISDGFYAGLHTVGGDPCHHLVFSQDNLEFQIWIEDGPQIVPRKFVVTYTDDVGLPQVTTIFHSWDFATKHPDSLFEAKIPESAEKIEFLSRVDM